MLEECGQSPGQRRAEVDGLTREIREPGFGTTRYSWDGDVLAWERNDLDNQTIHYVHEAESFVPLLRFNAKEDITEAFLERPADLKVTYMNEKGLYDPGLDPLHNGDYAPGIDAEGHGPKPLDTSTGRPASTTTGIGTTTRRSGGMRKVTPSGCVGASTRTHTSEGTRSAWSIPMDCVMLTCTYGVPKGQVSDM